MLNATFSSASIRGWKGQGQTLTFPVTFNSVKVLGNDLSKPLGSYLGITDNGGLVVSEGNIAANASNNIFTSNYFSSYTSSSLTNSAGTPFDINGDGSLLIKPGNMGNTDRNILLFSQSNAYNYSLLSNTVISNVPSQTLINDLRISSTGQIFAVALGNNNANSNTGAFAHIYSISGNTTTLQANIDYNMGNGSAYLTRLYVNNVGNYVLLNRGDGNIVQIWANSSNTWSRQANISQSNVTAAVINQYGNIIAMNIDDGSNDSTKIYTKTGNTWSLLQTIQSNIVGNVQSRPALDMNNSGNVIAISVNYGTANSRIQILNYDTTNGNYNLSQNLFPSVSSTADFALNTHSVRLSKNTGYLVAAASLDTIDIWTCLT